VDWHLEEGYWILSG